MAKTKADNAGSAPPNRLGTSSRPAQPAGTKVGGTSDWRSAMLARIRRLIQEADPDVVEEIKWRKPSNPAGVPVWSDAGIVCTGETYKDKVKLTFAKGALLADPSCLFNASLEGSVRRAIDFNKGVEIDEVGFKALVASAVVLNRSGH